MPRTEVLRFAVDRLSNALGEAEQTRLMLLSTVEHSEALVRGHGLDLESAVRQHSNLPPELCDQLLRQLRRWTGAREEVVG